MVPFGYDEKYATLRACDVVWPQEELAHPILLVSFGAFAYGDRIVMMRLPER